MNLFITGDDKARQTQIVSVPFTIAIRTLLPSGSGPFPRLALDWD